MAYFYTTRDGMRVEVNVAAAFDHMAAEFKRDTGYSLHINSGTRLRQDQIDIFKSRYVTASHIRGRRVYDTRWWNGQVWYRISSVGTVAVPGTSNHEENGPNGPRSIDIYDSGSDAGVTTRGTSRDHWMQNNAGRFGFENEGYNFAEAWHKTYRGKIGGHPEGNTGGGGSPASVPFKEDDMDIIHYSGKEYGIAPGFISHLGSVRHSVMLQATAGKPVVKVTNWTDMMCTLDNYGIPRSVFSGNGYIYNPESRQHESNGLWSWDRVNKVDMAIGNKAVLDELAALRKALPKK